jgi:hypothetical protein
MLQSYAVKPMKSTKLKVNTRTILIVVILVIGVLSGVIIIDKSKRENGQQMTNVSPTVVPTDAASVDGWKNYQNQKYGYSIEYPGEWFSLENSGAPDTEKYFSNKNVGAPLEMGEGGVWVTITSAKTSDSVEKLFTSNPGKIPQQQNSGHNTTKVANLTINNQPAVKLINETKPGTGTEYAYIVTYDIKREDTVISISFLTSSKVVADENMEIYDNMARSLRFPTGTSK